MRAVYYEKCGEPLQLISLDDPEPGADQVVIKVAKCGICGSDAHLTHVPGFYPEQSILGHEYSGQVVAVGKDVEGFSTGDRITALPAAGCGKCLACTHGVPLHCEQGTKNNTGGFADYLAVHTVTAVHLPQTLSLGDAALVEPLAVGLHGVMQARLTPGQPVLVIGAGSVALAAIYWARRMGAGKIIALSRSRRGEAMALKMGASQFLQSGENEVEEVVEALGGMPEVVFEAIGVPGVLERCIKFVAVNGKIVSLGFCTSPDPINAGIATFKQPEMHFSFAYTMREFEYAANTMDQGHVDPAQMITKTIPLEEVPAAVAALREGTTRELKIHADPSL